MRKFHKGVPLAVFGQNKHRYININVGIVNGLGRRLSTISSEHTSTEPVAPVAQS